MELSDLKVGMPIALNHSRRYDFAESGRVEATGCDWVIVRSPNNQIHLLQADDGDFEIFKPDEDE